MGRDACREAHLKSDKSRSSARRRKGVLPARFFYIVFLGLSAQLVLGCRGRRPAGPAG